MPRADPHLTQEMITIAKSKAARVASRANRDRQLWERYVAPPQTEPVPDLRRVIPFAGLVGVAGFLSLLLLAGYPLGGAAMALVVAAGAIIYELRSQRTTAERNEKVDRWLRETLEALVAGGADHGLSLAFLRSAVLTRPTPTSMRAEARSTFDHDGRLHEGLMVIEPSGDVHFEHRAVPRPRLAA